MATQLASQDAISALGSGPSSLNRASGVPIKECIRVPPPIINVDYIKPDTHKQVFIRSGPQSLDKEVSLHYQSGGHREQNFNSRDISSDRKFPSLHLQHDVYRDSPVVDNSRIVYHFHSIDKSFPKDMDIKPQQMRPQQLGFNKQRPDLPFQPPNNQETNIPKEIKPLMSVFSQDEFRGVHKPELENQETDPMIALPPGETPASMFRKRASLGKASSKLPVEPYASSTVQTKDSTRSGLRIEERLAQYADINLSGLPLNRDKNDKPSLSPIVIDHSVPATVLNKPKYNFTKVFEYNHRPGKRICEPARGSEVHKSIDYAHGKRQRIEETVSKQLPTPTKLPSKEIPVEIDSEIEEIVVAKPTSPEKKIIEASPVKPVVPVQLFPSAAAIQEKEMQLAKQQPTILPSSVAESKLLIIELF